MLHRATTFQRANYSNHEAARLETACAEGVDTQAAGGSFRSFLGPPSAGRDYCPGHRRTIERIGLRVHGARLRLGGHPHLHCVVPGGGLSSDGSHWIASHKEDFFVPVKVLSSVFRGKFLDYLKRAFTENKLAFHGRLAELAQAEAFQRLLTACYGTKWVVYAKPPFGGPEQVLKYLARYTHRVAISNQRLISLEDGLVTFRWKNYAAGNEQQTMTLTAVEFLRRFLLHRLPSHFVRIRHYGFLANRHRAEKLACCRTLLGVSVPEPPAEPRENREPKDEHDPQQCPVCGGRMRIVGHCPRPGGRQLLEIPWPWNTS